jgi:alcohol dehydrogenase/L-iditol 2-dehydrogenase
MEIVRPAGTIVKVGWGKTPLNASLDPIVQKAVNLHGSFSHNYPMWERVIRLMATGALDVRPLFNTYSLDEWETAFDEMESGTNIKSIIKF